MSNGDTIGLFTEVTSARRGPSAFFVSTVVHSAALGMLSYGLLNHPIIRDEIITERYTVRHLELHVPTPDDSRSGAGSDVKPEQLQASTIPSVDNPADVQRPNAPLIAPGPGGHQTLVQPEFHSHLALSEETPVPTIVMWTPELASSQKIVAAIPDTATATDAKPSLDAPNEELSLADIAISATDQSPSSLAMPPGTTSPIAVHAPELVQLAPATISISDEQPTPTAVVSLSDIRMPDGEVILPPVNETKSSSSGPQGQEQAKSTTGPIALTAPGKDRSQGSTDSSAAASRSVNSKGKSNLAVPLPEKSDKSRTATAPETETVTATNDQADTYHITLPKDGRFGVVVVGTSLAEKYPETLQVWNDRVAYTAYLHVGLTKNWILQYSLARSKEVSTSGTVARLEAPWPYDIMRPNLVSRDLNADALMIHGLVNQAGRFEALAIAFPVQYVRAAFVLRALQQWHFRPARQNGKAVAVEVLLIIPDELD